jgi:hypothetical protein
MNFLKVHVLKKIKSCKKKFRQRTHATNVGTFSFSRRSSVAKHTISVSCTNQETNGHQSYASSMAQVWSHVQRSLSPLLIGSTFEQGNVQTKGTEETAQSRAI